MKDEHKRTYANDINFARDEAFKVNEKTTTGPTLPQVTQGCLNLLHDAFMVIAMVCVHTITIIITGFNDDDGIHL